MNIIFAGYRKWSYKILENLLKAQNSKWHISQIITTRYPEANFHNTAVPCLSIDPKNLSNQTIKSVCRKTPDLFLFYGWSWIIPRDVYTRYLCLILHPSPLPKYRGGSPLQHQIINNETTSAVTILQAGEKIDAGSVYAQTPFSLTETLEDIFTRIVTIGTQDTIKVLDSIANKTIRPITQDENHATVFKRRKPEESELTIKDIQAKTSVELYNFIRALADPYPNAFIKCKDGKKLLITGAELEL